METHSKKLLGAFCAVTLCTPAFALEVRFADNTWGGTHIPKGQQCQKFGGGNPASPRLTVSDIPAGASHLQVAFSDRDSKKMNHGGHGVIQIILPTGATQATIPSVKGHSYQLPKGVAMVSEHKGAGWDKAGAYMPPCSGGKGHAYYVTVQSFNGEQVTGQTTLELGSF